MSKRLEFAFLNNMGNVRIKLHNQLHIGTVLKGYLINLIVRENTCKLFPLRKKLMETFVWYRTTNLIRINVLFGNNIR